MESLQIYLNSENADKYYNNSISDALYVLPFIEIPDGYHIYLSVVSCSIPYSWYNINDTNNKLSYMVNGVTTDLTFSNGNYNINQLVNYLNSLMTNFNVSYNVITNKLTFTHSIYDFIFNSSSCFFTIGFNHTSECISNNKILISQKCVNLQFTNRINIASNLISYNINKVNLNNNSLLCSIPVDKPPYSVIEYVNRNNYKTNLFSNTISDLNIKIYDEIGNILDLNGLHYHITLQIDVEAFK